MREHEYELLAGEFTVEQIASVAIDDRPNIGRYTINIVGFSHESSTIVIRAHEDLEVSIMVDYLNGKVKWLDVVVGSTIERSFFALGRWGPCEWNIVNDELAEVQRSQQSSRV